MSSNPICPRASRETVLSEAVARAEAAEQRLDDILNKSVPPDYRPVSFAALCDSLDSKQLEATVYQLLIWHIRRAEAAEQQVQDLLKEKAITHG